MPVPAEVSRENGKKGGRPKGTANKLTRSLANELIRQGCDGLSVMVENMLFWRGKAHELGEQHSMMIAKINSMPAEDRDAMADTLKEFNKLSAFYLAAREQCHKCAADVAPYTNPRLQSITVKKSTTITQISMELKSAADDSERATYRGGDAEVVPFKRSAGG